MMRLRNLSGALVACALVQAPLAAQSPASGEQLYRSACAACHGPDGRGQPQSRVGFDTPIPDFTDCSFATPEPDADWAAIISHGGPVRAFDRRMPAFGEALTAGEIERILGYVRGFCPTAAAWPRGELNLPRALVTEKAFPENEAVLTVAAAGGDEGSFGAEFLYERRLGGRDQFEIVVPLEAQRSGAAWNQGLGDVAVAIKHVLHHSLAGGRILSGAAEVKFPTGRELAGLGSGVTVFEPFLAYGQVLGSDGFLHLQSGVEIPSNRDRASAEAFWRAAIGRSFLQGGYGRTWSPMVEILGARELEDGQRAVWDVAPQMQVTLSKRQHVMVSAGVRLPVNAREGRRATFITYLLWDWFDGGFFDGWR
jgi:mono/diheme cytochrome c family protein